MLPRPRNRATLEPSPTFSEVGMNYMIFLPLAHNVLVVVEAASHMAVTAVLSVSAEEVHRNAKSTETAMLFESSHWLHCPRPTAIRFGLEGCFVSKPLTRLFSELRAEQIKSSCTSTPQHGTTISPMSS